MYNFHVCIYIYMHLLGWGVVYITFGFASTNLLRGIATIEVHSHICEYAGPCSSKQKGTSVGDSLRPCLFGLDISTCVIKACAVKTEDSSKCSSKCVDFTLAGPGLAIATQRSVLRHREAVCHKRGRLMNDQLKPEPFALAIPKLWPVPTVDLRGG